MNKFLLSFFGGILGGAIVLGGYQYFSEQKNPVLEYYVTENAVAVSPHDLRMEMDKGSGENIIVDLRSAPEYAKEHIKGAINIPGIDNDANAEAQEQRIVVAFQKLPKDKRIILHCYTHYCMLAKHVGLMLAKQGIYAHELNIGWNEWRYEWDLWNGNGTSKSVRIEDYLEGTEVGKTDIAHTGSIILAPCTADGLAGC